LLLDYVVGQGLTTKQLFAASDIQPEATSEISKPSLQPMFTATEVEEKIAQALAQREREKAEAELARFTEIRDAALQAAATELNAARR
jgi:hypothetical protein